MISGAGLVGVELAGQVDTFGGAAGEDKARQFGTSGYAIRASKPKTKIAALLEGEIEREGSHQRRR